MVEPPAFSTRMAATAGGNLQATHCRSVPYGQADGFRRGVINGGGCGRAPTTWTVSQV